MPIREIGGFFLLETVLTNCTIIRIDRSAANSGGDLAWTIGLAISIRAAYSSLTSADRSGRQNIAVDVTAKLIVQLADIAGFLPVMDSRMVIQDDGDNTAWTFQVHEEGRLPGGLSHVQLLGKAA